MSTVTFVGGRWTCKIIS